MWGKVDGYYFFAFFNLRNLLYLIQVGLTLTKMICEFFVSNRKSPATGWTEAGEISGK